MKVESEITWDAAGLCVLADRLAVLLGEPVNNEGHDDRGSPRGGRKRVAPSGQNGGGDNRSVDTGSAASSRVPGLLCISFHRTAQPKGSLSQWLNGARVSTYPITPVRRRVVTMAISAVPSQDGCH
jgi:hypothetical protein